MRQAQIATAAEWQSDAINLLLARATYTADDIQDALAANITPSNPSDDNLIARQHNVMCRLVDTGANPNGNNSRHAGPVLFVAVSSAGL